ncbi:helix-turn-helix domain-containing protein [uncultured Duncaniella sp.]|uniref:helix-turn-helix domain-containing protein n=1 Tax=uncultured Duncaniella sp. TaxID=2768039 RepID=UPI00259C7B38|nr:helix-turn-helix domain-containing protein [uncultured Duncaniella sp.]
MSKSQLNSAPTSFMLMIPQEEWQSLHDKLDRLIEIVEKTQIGSPGKDWFESDEVRKILGISPKTWQNYRDQRLIPFSQIGRKIYVSRADLDAFLRSHRIGTRK